MFPARTITTEVTVMRELVEIMAKALVDNPDQLEGSVWFLRLLTSDSCYTCSAIEEFNKLLPEHFEGIYSLIYTEL